MSEYNKTILTNAGIDLARRANKGAATFQLTRGVSSTENLSEKTIEELQNLTKLPSIQQSVILSDVVNTTDNPDTVLGIRMTFDNQNLKTGYNVHTVGIYAKEPGKNEILYGVATAKTPEYIPDFGEETLFKFDFLMYLVIGRTDKVTVEVSPDDVYLKKDTYNKTEIDTKVSELNKKDAEIIKDLNDYKQENKTYHQQLEDEISRELATKADKTTVDQQLDTKADKLTTYTKDEVDNRISPKADKSYVDGELSKKADKATTYTKDEVNSKIAGQVKSVNGHRADSNGEVTLPKLKAKTLIAYDVPNKRPTYDENAGFDGNGNFSHWPVDQIVISQLADAINAKLPIEAGAADDDLCYLTSSKISFWNGNGENVKNLPPMSNKRWYFAIRLVGPDGWGSVTVVDQDGTYWLNTKNDDIWAGWRSVTTNETLKKLKFVKQSLNQNGDIFQDTKFVTQEADGTFKINIYDSDWTASKVSWLLKNTQSYNIAANTDLNNIKAPGLYHCSGASNIANVPDGEDNWFNMVVNSDNWNGSQVFYATNSNQLYIRTWNNSGFKQWRRLVNDGDYSSLQNLINSQKLKVVRSYDIEKDQAGSPSTEAIGDQSVVDQSALATFADAHRDVRNHTDFRYPTGIDQNTSVNLNSNAYGETGIYRFVNCVAINGPWTDLNQRQYFYMNTIRYDDNSIYQLIFRGAEVYARTISERANLYPGWSTFATMNSITDLSDRLQSFTMQQAMFQHRVDYDSPSGTISDDTVDFNNYRETGILKVVNCLIQNGPYKSDYRHTLFLKITNLDGQNQYQTVYEGDNLYGRKLYNGSGQWYKYTNTPI